MITNFKIFESDRLLYIVGDYVLLDLNEDYIIDLIEPYAIVTHVFANHITAPYELKTFDDVYFMVEVAHITRKLTQEEIEKFNILKDTTKYNL